MKHLIINSYGVFLGLKSQRLAVYKNKEITKEIALKNLKTISVKSNGVSFSSDLIFACSVRGIKIFFHDYSNFSALHSLYEHKGVNVLREQFLSETNGKGLELARQLIIGKIKNQRSTVLYFSRNLNNDCKAATINALEAAIYSLKNTANLSREMIFGFEGEAANAYFDFLKNTNLLPSSFQIRTKRFSDEVTNQALNYGYAILLNFIYKSLINAGLNPYFGVLHSLRSAKPSFALDVMEEYRSFVVDRNVIKIRNSLSSSLDERSKKLLASLILDSFGKKLTYNGKKLTLESIVQRQIYKISGFFCGDKKYKSYIFRW